MMLEIADSPVAQQVGVLVVGAGPAGLCHALWLRQYDVDVLVIDADLRSHGREWVTLGPDALSVLRRVGIQSELDHARVDYDAVVITPLRAARAPGQRPCLAKRPRLLRLPAAPPGQAPLSLVNRAVLEEVLEHRARELGVQIEHGQRLQRVEIRPSHCEARVVPSSDGRSRAEPHPMVTARDSVRRLLAHWVIGTDGYRSVVRRDLRAGFRAIADPRTASIVHIVGRRSVDVEGAVQVSVGDHAVHTVWPLGGEQLLWVMQATGPELPAEVELDARGPGTTPLALSTNPVRYGNVTEAFVEREAERVGIQVQEVLSAHALHYRPSVAEPQGRGRAWTSGPAAQVIAPALGHDDALGLLEVPDLALLLGFGGDDGMVGLPTLTPRLYHERRARIQQYTLGAHPLGGEPSGHHWPDHDRGSIDDREAVANVLAFLAPVARAVRSPGSPSRFGSTSVRA